MAKLSKNVNGDRVVLLFDNYTPESEKLHKSFLSAGYNYPFIIINTDGFLPDGAMNPYEYFLNKVEISSKGKPLYFSNVKLPYYWEAKGDNTKCEIFDNDTLRGCMYYSSKFHNKRYVNIIDWKDDKGRTRSCDHYNKNGDLFARSVLDSEGKTINRTYLTPSGKEIIVENFVTGSIILELDGVTRVFPNKVDFVMYFIKCARLGKSALYYNSLGTPFLVSLYMAKNDAHRKDVLFWQEDITNIIPGNMQYIIDGKSRTRKIYVQKHSSFTALKSLGVGDIIEELGYIYEFKKENKYSNNALICTNSDNLMNIEELITRLPEVEFNICAVTNMSEKLMKLDTYNNVHLYPNITLKKYADLLERCDIYLDINISNIILNSIETAFLHNMAIFAFKDSVHDTDFVSPNAIFKEVNGMVDYLKLALSVKDGLKKYIDEQLEVSLATSADKYNV